tara:strand:- start:41 stop:2005 length:1965 start_codon:yes stop_codon:yes gene_type:complete
MDLATQRLMQGAAGAGGDKLYIDDVFSTFLYDGTNGSLSANTGLDMSGEGGLLWIKNRTDSGRNNTLFDTERGVNQRLKTDSSGAENTFNANQTFTSTGFTLNCDFGDLNQSSKRYCSWNFRKTPGFFDIVTWTGNGVAGRQISHSLGSSIGFLWVKRRNGSSENWCLWHRTFTGAQFIEFTVEGVASNSTKFGSNPSMTSSYFTVGSDDATNNNGDSYVAYVFAHDNQSFGDAGNQSVIKCDSFTGNGNSNGPTINLGFEPQYILTKNKDRNQDWLILDSMRGLVTGGNDPRLKPENATSESSSYDFVDVSATGFQIKSTDAAINANGEEILYMAIRRPDGYVGKPVELGTDVLTMTAGTSGAPLYPSPNHIVDFALQKSSYQSGTADWTAVSRLTQGFRLETNTTDAESANIYQVGDYQNGWSSYTGGDGSRFAWLFKRHAGFDVVAWKNDTNSTYKSIPHSLGKKPEMIWLKDRDNTSTDFYQKWKVWHSGLTPMNNALNSRYIVLNTNAAETNSGNMWGQSDSDINENSFRYYTGIVDTTSNVIAILFASTDVSKVGSYTGTGSSGNTITVGFQPRFVIIKNTSRASTSWVVLDTTRGWGSGDDKSLELNDNNAQETYDYGAPTSTGFTLDETGIWTNYANDVYIYYAHA